MRVHGSSNANGNFTKPFIVKAGSTFTFPKMVPFPPVIDLQSSLPLPNRTRILSLEFHSSRPLPQTPLLSRNLLKKLVDQDQVVTPDSMDLENTFCTRTHVPYDRTARALDLAPSQLSSPFKAELPLHPRAARQNNDDMCLTPAPSFERDVSMSDPPALEREESRILHSPTMPRELFVPDDF